MQRYLHGIPCFSQSGLFLNTMVLYCFFTKDRHFSAGYDDGCTGYTLFSEPQLDMQHGSRESRFHHVGKSQFSPIKMHLQKLGIGDISLFFVDHKNSSFGNDKV